MSEVDISRGRVEHEAKWVGRTPAAVLLALRDALDKAEKDVAFQAQRAATSEAEIGELKANELRLHQIIYKLSDEPKELRATIARQQRMIEAAESERDLLRSQLASKCFDLAAAETQRNALVRAMQEVCCDPEWHVCIRGSNGDRKVLQDALDAALSAKRGD